MFPCPAAVESARTHVARRDDGRGDHCRGSIASAPRRREAVHMLNVCDAFISIHVIPARNPSIAASCSVGYA